MKIFIKYWWIWGILLLIIGFLIVKNWKTVSPLIGIGTKLSGRNICKDKCNKNYQVAINNCNHYTGTIKQHCLQVAEQEWGLCLSKCK